MINDIYNYYEPVMEPMNKLPNTQEDELTCDKDLSYIRRLYPVMAQEIIVLVDGECDKLEYQGSFMFDEYPDKQNIIDMTDRIYNQMNISAQSRGHRYEDDYNYGKGYGYGYGPGNYLRDLIGVLILDNMHYRRQRYNRRRRMFY